MALNREKMRYCTSHRPWVRGSRLLRRTMLIAVAIAPPLWAQNSWGRPEFHAAIDVGFPSGDLGTQTSAWLGGLMGVGVYSAPNGIGLRVEGMYQALRTSRGTVTVCEAGQCSVQPSVGGANIDVTLDIVGRSSLARTPKVYLIGGLGIYQTGALLPVATPAGFHEGIVSASGAGWNIGAGVGRPIAGAWCYIEARYYGVPVADNQHGGLVPIMAGVRF